MSQSLQFTPQQLEQCKASLDQFLAASPDFWSAIISTVDGRLLVERSRREIGGSRVASMAGSLIALGEALSSELHVKPCHHVTVSAQLGVVVLLHVHDSRNLLALTTSASHEVKLGTLLAASRRTATLLSQMALTKPPLPQQPRAGSQ
jgi:predicted regulator of Ras-like GTPase activity (Roadblock/LC7/MglB family)